MLASLVIKKMQIKKAARGAAAQPLGLPDANGQIGMSAGQDLGKREASHTAGENVCPPPAPQTVSPAAPQTIRQLRNPETALPGTRPGETQTPVHGETCAVVTAAPSQRPKGGSDPRVHRRAAGCMKRAPLLPRAAAQP